MGILDTIIDSKHADLAKSFRPLEVVAKILEQLRERDRAVLTRRYGLAGEQAQTLESIGKDLKLTRERVRQIEKSLLKQLQTDSTSKSQVASARELLHALLTEHGGIMAEIDLLERLGLEAVEEAQAVRFLLLLIKEVTSIRGHEHLHDAWATLQFEPELFNKFLSAGISVLQAANRPHGSEEFLKLFKQTDFYHEHASLLPDKVIANFLAVARDVSQNAFGEYGLTHWREINPKDVGDKAYLVLRHHGKPEHYAAITDLINRHYSGGKKAYRETVHNELIKDGRFVLVGRGIYALAEWGYKPGVVADVIEEVLKNSKKPMSRDEILTEVLKKRFVKKNTVMVSLSNKKRFEKVGRNQYSLAAR